MKQPVYTLPNGSVLVFDGPMLSIAFDANAPLMMLVNDGSHGLLVLAKIIKEEGLRMRARGL